MLIFIDVENLLFEKIDFFQKICDFVQGLNSDTFVLKESYQNIIEKIINDNKEITLNDFLELVFIKFDKESFLSILQVRKKSYASIKPKLFFYNQVSNFELPDLGFLKILFRVIFCVFKKSKLEQLFLKCAFEEFLELFYFDEECDNLLKNEFYLVSQRPSFWKEKLQNFDFNKKFIYAYNYILKQEIKKQENLIANELNIYWDLLSLKCLFNKMKIIERCQDKKVLQKQVKIGIFGDNNFMEYNDRIKIFQDSDGLIFQFMDPFDLKNNNLEIDSFYCKFSYFMSYYNLYKEDDVKSKINELNNIIKDLEEKNNKKIKIFDSFEYFPIFVDRKALSIFFKELLSQEEIVNNLQQQNITLSFPNTLDLEIEQLDQIENILNENKISFPVLIKTKWAASALTKFSHNLILIKNKEALINVFKNNTLNIKKLFPIVIQELVDPVPFCQKIYLSFGNKISYLYNSIDLSQYQEDVIDIDGAKSLKTLMHKDQYKEESSDYIIKCLNQALKKKGIQNYGLDLIKKDNTNEYYIIDMNFDTFTWFRLGKFDDQYYEIRNEMKKQIQQLK